MKITIQRSTLIEHLSQVVKAASGRTTIPILEGVLIHSDSELTLTCSDTQLTIMATLTDYEEHEAGTAVVPARKLFEIVRKMPEKEIVIQSDGTNVTIRCGSTKVNLPVMDADDFPQKFLLGRALIEIGGEDFARLVDNTKFAVSNNESTPILQGVLLEYKAGKLTAIATDRHRLATQSIGVEEESEEGRYVAPVRALEAVAGLKPDKVEIGFITNEMHMRAGDYQYIAALHDGTYPDTSKIIPNDSEIKSLVDSKKLLQTLELAEKIVDDKTKIVKLEVSEGELYVSAEDGGAGMEECLEAEVTGDEIKLSVNVRFLIDALKCVTTERAELWFIGPMSPIVIRNEGDDSGLNLVLPYRT